jgi:hypothetical protein
MTVGHRRRGQTGAAAALVLAGLAVAPVRAATPGCAARTRIGPWTYVASPVWPAGDNEGLVPVGTYSETFGASHPAEYDSAQSVVGAANSRRILLSNHRTLLRSLDGGCTWTAVFTLTGDAGRTVSLAPMLAGVPGAVIRRVVVPRSASAAARPVIYLVLAAAESTTYAVVRSADDGNTWQPVTPDPTAGAAPARTAQPGLPQDLAVAPGSPSTAYLCVDCYNGIPWLPPKVYVTHDSGATWTAATAPTLAAGDNFGSALFTVDPVDAASVWLRTGYGVYHSSDSAAHWSSVLGKLGWGFVPVAVVRGRGQRHASVVVPTLNQTLSVDDKLIATAPSGLVSPDDGRHWQQLPDLPLPRLGFVGARHFLGPLALSYDASGNLCGYLPNGPTGSADPNLSGIVLFRHGRWQAAHAPYRSGTYPYDRDGVFTMTAAGSPVLAIGLDGARGATPALVEYEVPR